MARRDNVKARKRLKKPKKIYTNNPTDQGIGTPKFSRLKKYSATTRGQRHSSKHKTYYTDYTGKVRVLREYKSRIAIQIQTAGSKQFNKYGLQQEMSPQKLQSIRRDVDIFLISQKVSPQTRAKIMNTWGKYISAAYGYNRAKTEERKKINAGIIKVIEQNPQLLGLKATFIKQPGLKEAYVLNHLTTGQIAKNFSDYEEWYNKVRNKRIVERTEKKQEEQASMPTLVPDLGGLINDLFGESKEIETKEELPTENNNSPESYDYDDYDDDIDIDEAASIASSGNYDDMPWHEYWFYDIKEATDIITNMGGWHTAITKYPGDVQRICNCAGYLPSHVRAYMENGIDPGPPDPDLVWDGLFEKTGGGGTKYNPRVVEYRFDGEKIILETYKDRKF